MSLRDDFASLLANARASAQEREDNDRAKRTARETGRDADLLAWARDFLKKNLANIKWINDPRGAYPVAELHFAGLTDQLDDAIARGVHLERVLVDAGITVDHWPVEQEAYVSTPPVLLPFTRACAGVNDWMLTDAYGGLSFAGTTNEYWYMRLRFSAPQ